jgi:hypothetical protein
MLNLTQFEEACYNVFTAEKHSHYDKRNEEKYKCFRYDLQKG